MGLTTGALEAATGGAAEEAVLSHMDREMGLREAVVVSSRKEEVAEVTEAAEEEEVEVNVERAAVMREVVDRGVAGEVHTLTHT